MSRTLGVRRRRSWQRILRETIRQVFIYAVLVVAGTAFMLPFLWSLSSSLKPYGAGIRFPPEFIPKEIVWGNYPQVFRLTTDIPVDRIVYENSQNQSSPKQPFLLGDFFRKELGNCKSGGGFGKRVQSQYSATE